MNVFFARSRLSVALVGVLLVALGVFVLAHPVQATVVISRLAGIACAIVGVGWLLEAWRDAGSLADAPRGALVMGGVLTAVGAVVALFPDVFVNVIFTVLGIGVVLTGIADIARAGELRGTQEGGWRLSMAIGSATLLLGSVIVMAPLVAAAFVPTIAGIVLVIDGVSEILLALRH